VTLVTLLWMWALIVAACAVTYAIARFVGKRLDAAEARQSLRQWQLMCEALGAEDLSASTTPTAAVADVRRSMARQI
jgi:hypothetical protein